VAPVAAEAEGWEEATSGAPPVRAVTQAAVAKMVATTVAVATAAAAAVAAVLAATTAGPPAQEGSPLRLVVVSRFMHRDVLDRVVAEMPVCSDFFVLVVCVYVELTLCICIHVCIYAYMFIYTRIFPYMKMCV